MIYGINMLATSEISSISDQLYDKSRIGKLEIYKFAIYIRVDQ